MNKSELIELRVQLEKKLEKAQSKIARLTKNRQSAAIAAATGDADAKSAVAEMNRQSEAARLDVETIQAALVALADCEKNAEALESAEAELQRAAQLRQLAAARQSASEKLDAALAEFSAALRGWFETGANLAAVTSSFKQTASTQTLHGAFQQHVQPRYFPTWLRDAIARAGTLTPKHFEKTAVEACDWKHTIAEAERIEESASAERDRAAAVVADVLAGRFVGATGESRRVHRRVGKRGAAAATEAAV